MFLVNHNYLNGVLRFSNLCIAVDAIILAHFIFSWFLSKRNTGRLIDYWHFIVLVFFIIPVVIMYPFNASIYNVMSVHDSYSKIEPYINNAYLITVVGYASVILGGVIGRKRYKKKDRGLVFFVERFVEKSLSNEISIRLIAIFLLVSMFLFVIFQVCSGNVGDPRAFFMAHEKYRPIYNALISMFKFTLIFVGLLVISKRNYFNILVFSVMCCLGIFLGTRSAILEAITYIFVFWAMSKGSQVKIWYAFIFAAIMVAAIFVLGKFRHSGGENGTVFDFLVYGNVYSDTRDFAWILANWDYNYVLGKTYLSGFLSFIPAHLSDYRETWAISRYTNSFVGFDSTIHPGLRPGKFGEPYFNFGIFGVIALGLWLGYWLRYANDSINKNHFFESRDKNNNIFSAYAKTIPFQVSSYLCITAGFFELYVLIGMLVIMFFIRNYK